jgi:hypothetical protein
MSREGVPPPLSGPWGQKAAFAYIIACNFAVFRNHPFELKNFFLREKFDIFLKVLARVAEKNPTMGLNVATSAYIITQLI